MTTIDLTSHYQALTETAGLVDVSDRPFVELTGADRAKFLHNLCSNDIRSLAPGQGCEALLLNAKGKVVGHVFAYAGEESIILDSAPDQGPAIAAHLDRYIIREKVEVADQTAKFSQWLLGGPQAGAILEQLGAAPPAALLGHGRAELAGQAVFLRRSGLIGPDSYTVVCLPSQKDDLARTLQAAGAVRCEALAFEAARIEAGIPLYGRDITEDNLPQEVDRNPQAINFNKGCYLGQETVARIDALGHVNRTLVGLRIGGEQLPLAGAELTSGDAVVGRVTSAAYSPRYGAVVALGYVRQGPNQPGARLVSPTGEAEVVALPMR